MEITRNVIQDLLPLYLAGEVCPETHALVEEFLGRDALLAAEVERLKSDSLKPILMGGTVMALPKDHDIQTLERTRSTIAQRSWRSGAGDRVYAYAAGVRVSGRTYSLDDDPRCAQYGDGVMGGGGRVLDRICYSQPAAAVFGIDLSDLRLSLPAPELRQ